MMAMTNQQQKKEKKNAGYGNCDPVEIGVKTVRNLPKPCILIFESLKDLKLRNL